MTHNEERRVTTPYQDVLAECINVRVLGSPRLNALSIRAMTLDRGSPIAFVRVFFDGDRSDRLAIDVASRQGHVRRIEYLHIGAAWHRKGGYCVVDRKDDDVKALLNTVILTAQMVIASMDLGSPIQDGEW